MKIYCIGLVLFIVRTIFKISLIRLKQNNYYNVISHFGHLNSVSIGPKIAAHCMMLEKELLTLHEVSEYASRNTQPFTYHGL